MAQDNSNSTMEMGTSDQVLVATKRKKTIGYIVGTIAMLAVGGVVIALIIVLSPDSSSAATTPAPIVSETTGSDSSSGTTEGPTSPLTPSSTSSTTSSTTTSTTTTTTTSTTTTEGPSPDGPPGSLDLEEIIDGAFSPPSFNATWTTGSDLMFRNDNGDLLLYNVDTDSTMPLISNISKILQESSRVMQMSADGKKVILAHSVIPVYRYSFLAHYTAVTILTQEEVSISPPGVARDQAILQNLVWGPSGTSLAFVYYNNIYYQPSLTDPPRQITTTGVLGQKYHGTPDWVYEEEVFGSSNAIWFSKDGNKMAYVTFDDTGVDVMRVPHYGVPGDLNYQYTRHRDIRYPKPGKTNPSVSVTLRDLKSNDFNEYEAPNDMDEPILKAVKFISNTAIALVWTNRVQTALRVQRCTAGVTACTTIFNYAEENGWIDNIPFFFNDAGNAFITILPQAVDGVLFKQIVQVTENVATTRNRVNNPHTVLEILAWGSDDVIWYKATSVSDSREQHIFSVNSQDVISCFTCNIRRQDGGQCLYNEATISNSGDRITINCAGPDVPQILIYDTNGELVRVWDEGADLSALTNDRVLPVILRAQIPTALGQTAADIHIQAPADYAQRTNVPLLVYVYGGPDTALVTKQWNLDWGSSLVSRWGIAVAHIDGRGSGLRGVANMFALNRKLGTVEVEDQIAGAKYIQDNFPWIDANRTCIWGWSYGGYAASKALAEGGDVFRCAAAVAPVVDWRFYDTIYTERYMGFPTVEDNLAGYATASLLTDQVAESLRDKSYFLIHGTADDNVHYQHAMLLSRLLQRKDVFFTQMSYTDEDHGLVGVRPHLYHALEKFLQEYML